MDLIKGLAWILPGKISCAAAVSIWATLGVTEAFAQTQFSDVTDAAGVGIFTESYGASWGDLNSDGYLDLFVNNHRLQPSLFLNMGDGTFYNTGSQVKTWVNRSTADTHGGTWADFDNDGDQDLLITTGTGNPNQFFVNENSALIDKTLELGVEFDNVGGRLPVWLDYNGDGLLDFVITQFGGVARLFTQTATDFVENRTAAGLLCLQLQYGQLYDVDGNGRLDFVCPDDGLFPQKIYDTLPLPWADITILFPTVDQVPDSVIGDFDNDQRMDMFLISNVQLRPSSVLLADSNTVEANLTGGEKGFNFISNGPITIDLDWNKIIDGFGLAKILIGANGASPFAVPFTLDPDDPSVAGLPLSDPAAAPIMRIGYDPATQRWTIIHQTENIFSEAYYIVTTDQPVIDLQSTGLWGSDQAGSPTLITNFSGGFTDNTVAAGLDTPVECASATAGDFDNDMDLDLYLACRTGAENLENIYYDNQGDGTFVTVASAGGAAGPIGSNVTSGAGTADSVVTADYDVDGFLDVFVTNGLGLRPKGFGGQNKLFRNQGNTNHWIELDLVGTLSTREPVGARVTATANGVTQLRVFNGGYHRWSQEPNRMHFGLATATTVDLIVQWPTGTLENFPAIAADQLYTITEGAGIAVTTPGNSQPYPCGAPSFDPATEAGVFVWRDCTLDEWRVRFTSGGPWQSYSGRLVSDSGFSAVSPVSLEAGDILDFTTDPLQITYKMGMRGSGTDGFNLGLTATSNACFELDSPAGASIYYGPFKTLLSAPFDLVAGGACSDLLPELSVSNVAVSESVAQADFIVSLSAASTTTVTVDVSTIDGTASGGEDYAALTPTTTTFAPGEVSKTVSLTIFDDLLGEEDEAFTLALTNPSGATLARTGAVGTIIDDEVSACGGPVFDAATEAGAFIWKDCTSGQWQVRMTAGGSATTLMYSGSIVSNAAFSQVAPFSTETSDILDSITDPLQIVYNLKMVNAGVDGVDFVPAPSSTLCFELDAPPGATVYAGADRTIVTPPFDPNTLGACGGLLPVLTVNNVSVSEAAGQVDLVVSLSEISTSTVTIDVQTTDGSAISGFDFTAQPSTSFMFAPGELSKTVSIPILEDGLAEGDETFMLELSNVTNATIGVQSGTVTITDNEISPCGEPLFDAGTEAGAFVWQNCATGEWHARVTGGGVFTRYIGRIVSTAPYTQVSGFSLEASDTLDFTSDPLQIAYQLDVSGSGRDGVDFMPATGASSCFELDAPAGAVVYLGQSKAVVAQPFDLSTLGGCGGLLPEISLSDQAVNEKSGQVNITVSLSAASTSPVMVDIQSADGLALAGADYIALSVTTLTIDPGQLSKTVTLSVLDDAIAEGDETLTLALSNPVLATLGTATSTLTIVDDEVSPCGEPIFDPATEAGVFVWKDCTTAEWHSRVSSGGVFTTYSGSVVSSAAFAQLAGFSIEASDILDLTSDPASATYQLSVSNGGLDGIDFLPAPGSSTCFSVDTPAAATVYVGAGRAIITAPFELNTLAACGQTPGLSVTDVSVPESGSAVFTVNLSAPAGAPVIADYTTVDGVAVSPADYGLVAGSLTIPVGSLSATVTVPVVNDGLIEGDEDFSLMLSNPVSATLTKAVGVATITDDDSAVLSIDSVSANEVSGALTFTVSLSTANLVPVTVDYVSADVSTTAGADYVAVPLTTLTFNPAEVSKAINLTLLDDADTEGDETLALTLSNPVGAGLATAVGVGTITDSEPLPVLSIADAAAQESVGLVTFSLSLSTASTQPITVDYVSVDGSAASGIDYTAIPLSTLIINPGEVTRTIDVPLLDDTEIESDETFTVLLSNPTRAALGIASATGTINDNESRPTLTMGDLTASEKDGTLIFTATLSTSSAVSVSVDYVSVDGTATALSDYSAVSGTLTFAPGSTSETVTVTLFDDTELEFDESFTIALSKPVELNLGTTTAVATITDDEALVCGEPVYDPATEAGVFIWQDCGTTGEWHARMTAGGGTFRSYPGSVVSNQGFTNVAGVSIESGDYLDFTTNPTTILFTLGMSPPGVDGFDFNLSPDATVCFNVNLPPGTSLYAGAGRVPVATSSVDLKTLGPCSVLPELRVSDVAVVETDGVASFTLNLSASSLNLISVDYQTTDGTATAGMDYTALPPSTLVFNPGEVSKTVDVTLLDNTDIEVAEVFTLDLSHIVNASLGTAKVTSVAIATITDDEVAPMFSVSDLSVSELDSSVSFSVNLAAPEAVPVMVDVETVDGSSTAGLDYIALPLTTLTFAAGEMIKTVTLSLLDDVLAEGPETFQIKLSNAVGALISAPVATVTVTDDEPSPCGVPSYDKATESALFIWKDCTSGQWSARVTGGDSFKIFRGQLSSSAAFVSVAPFSIEASDILDFTTDPAVIDYSELRVAIANEDGFDFTLVSGTTACVSLDEPAGAVAYLGAARTLLTAPFDLASLSACSPN